MNDFDAILELHRSETFVSDEEKAWEKWLRDLEAKMNLSDLDGDQDEDGYSIDFAYDLFSNGDSVAEAAEEFKMCIKAIEEPENDGQPSMYEEYQDLHGGDDSYDYEGDIG